MVKKQRSPYIYIYFSFFMLNLGGSRKRPHPGSSRNRNADSSVSRQYAAAASPKDYRGQHDCGRTHPTTTSMQPPSSYHSSDPYYHPAGAGRAGQDASIDPQYASPGSMDHPHVDHTHSQPDHQGGPPHLQANFTSSPYLYKDHSGVRNVLPHKQHKGLTSYSELNRMSPIPEVSYNAPSRTASYNTPKSGPLVNLHCTNSYRDHQRQASDTVV